jgi:hypothetical protein
LMFAIEPWLFSIITIAVPTLIWSNQLVKLITSTGLNLVKHVNKPIELVFEPHIFLMYLLNLCLHNLIR